MVARIERREIRDCPTSEVAPFPGFARRSTRAIGRYLWKSRAYGAGGVQFQTELTFNTLRHSYAVSADGQRFLLNTSLEAGSPPMTVVLNWPALLKK